MKSKTMKIILVSIMLLTFFVTFNTTVFAASTTNNTTGIEITMDPSTIKGTSSDLSNTAQSLMNTILGVVQVVALSLAVIMLIFLGIKYISAAPAEKADVKKGALIYVVGAVLLFGASGILQVIKGFAGTIQY